MSLLIDYPFAAYPDNFGHWAELLLPIYNVIEERTCSQGHAVASSRIDSLVMTNVRKQSLVVSRALSLQGSCHHACFQGLLHASSAYSSPKQAHHLASWMADVGYVGDKYEDINRSDRIPKHAQLIV